MSLVDMVNKILVKVPSEAGPKQKQVYEEMRPLTVEYLQYWWDKVDNGDGDRMIELDAELTDDGLILSDGTF